MLAIKSSLVSAENLVVFSRLNNSTPISISWLTGDLEDLTFFAALFWTLSNFNFYSLVLILASNKSPDCLYAISWTGSGDKRSSLAFSAEQTSHYVDLNKKHGLNRLFIKCADYKNGVSLPSFPATHTTHWCKLQPLYKEKEYLLLQTHWPWFVFSCPERWKACSSSEGPH